MFLVDCIGVRLGSVFEIIINLTVYAAIIVIELVVIVRAVVSIDFDDLKNH